jgi:serine/threonine protein kinase
LKPGDRVRDYVLEKRIGAGGVGEVWRARHERLNKSVAIKLILPHLYQDDNIYNRFVQEAIATANLEHPHIISVYDFFSIQDDAFLVMSYIEGGSLQDRLKNHGRLSLSEALRIARGILDALDFAHQKGIVHRDVKPSNILLSPDSHAYLVDFGIALILGKTRITRFGANVGTPDYMSPEQIRGGQLDHRTDVYSFGCVLYEMLAGRSPFRRSEEDTEFALMERHISDSPTPLRILNSEVNEETEAAVMRALAKDREKRFAGCAAMAKALLVPTGTSTGGPSSILDKTSRVSKVAVAVLALSTLVSAGGWMVAYGEKERLKSANPPLIRDDGSLGNDARNSEAGLAASKKTAELEAANENLRKELQGARSARERAEKDVQDLNEKLAGVGSSDKTAVAKLQKELQETKAAYAKTVKEVTNWKQQQQQMEVKEHALQAAKKPIESPAKPTIQIPGKGTAEIAKHLSLAREYNERGAYDEALSQLSAANALDSTNNEVAAAIESTKRACNAEKRLGRRDLKC